MKEVFKNFINSIIALSILALLVGIVMIVYPGISLITVGIMVAAYLIVHGITLIVLDIRAWRLYIPFDGMLQGILCLILGVLLAMYPEYIAYYIGVFVGCWVIVSGFGGIKFSVALKGTDAHWVLMIIMYIIDIIIGCFMIFTPVITSVSLTILLGCVLIVHSIINIVDMIMAKKNAKETEKLIKEKLA